MRHRWIVGVLVTLMVTASAASDCPPFGETLGVNTHYGTPRGEVDPAALLRLADAGVRWIRNDLDWASVERVRGTYDFATPGVDTLVEAADTAGLRIGFRRDQGTPLAGPARAVVDAAGREAFTAFAAAAAGRYTNRGYVGEIWNEPNMPQFWSGGGARPNAADYAQLVATAAPAIRAADPSGRVLIGSAFMALPSIVAALGGVPGRQFLEQLFASGALAHADAVSAHFYRGGPPETVAAEVRTIRALMQAAGTEVPLWSGEWGYSTY